MNREATLGVLAVTLVVGAAGVALLAPGAVAEKSDADVRPSHLDLREPRVATGQIGGETVELSLDVRMEHYGGTADNVTVEVQAVDTETGLVARTVRKRLGDLSGDREIRTRVNVSVRRQGGYRIHTRVYENGSRVASESTDVRGVASLTPDYARTPIEFHRFGSSPASLPPITYTPANTRNNRTTLRTQTFLTNRGDEAAGGLELVVMARQVESNVIADRATVTVGDVGPGQTVSPTAELEVPTGYNYYLDGILKKDGVVVGTTTATAMLDPTRAVPENRTREEVQFSAGDFDGSNTPDAAPDRDTPAPTASGSGPGFGVGIALAAILAVAALAARRQS